MPDYILNKSTIADLLDDVNSAERKNLRSEAVDRFMFYNGNIQPIIKKAIAREFKKPETIDSLCSRIIPINVVRKIIEKLAAVYVETPIRTAGNMDELDQELIDLIVDYMYLNVKMKQANAYYKLDKKVLSELYLNEEGYPSIRNLPSFCYEVYSHSAISPEIPDTVIKILYPEEHNKEKQQFIIWTNEQVTVVNGHGYVNQNYLNQIGNPDGINPYKTLPFIYLADCGYGIDPIQDDDLIKTATAINVVTSDLLFASKFKSWGMVYTVGYNGDLDMNPNSIIHLDYDVNGNAPQINQLSPDINIDGMLRVIEALLSMLLSSRNLSAKTITNTLSADNIASGVSKAIDQSEVLEDRKKQYDAFNYYEQQLWNKLAFDLWPVWRQGLQMPQELNREFSKDFSVSVQLREPKVMMTEQELIEVESLKYKEGFTTLHRVLANLNPDMNEEELAQLEREILEEKAKKVQAMQESMSGFMEDKEDSSEDMNGDRNSEDEQST